jgi:hypothetical protein
MGIPQSSRVMVSILSHGEPCLGRFEPVDFGVFILVGQPGSQHTFQDVAIEVPVLVYGF